MVSLVAFVSLCILLLAARTAHFILWGQSLSVVHHDHQRAPPALPYALPVLGHLPQFLLDTEKLLAKAATRYGPTTPVQLKLLSRRITILNGPSNIATLFKGSRSLSSERWLVQVLVNAFGINAKDVSFYHADDTGIAHQPLSESNEIASDHRIFHLVYRSVHEGLSGARLEEMQYQLIHNLSTQLAAVDIGYDVWTDIADLYGSFIRSFCFRASITSLCGPRIFQAAPTLEADFWNFDKHLPNLFREMPRWLCPDSYRSRDKMKHNMARWHKLAHHGYDIGQSDTDTRNWEENFGSKLMRSRHAFFQKMPLSRDTIAGDDLGLLWAATANAIPAIGWMLLEVLQRPGLVERVRAEMAPHIGGPSGIDPADIKIDQLCQQPLIQSIYAEVLRVHNGTVIARVPQTPDFSIAGWTFPQNEPIMVSSYDTARVPSVWNQGTPEHPHSVHEFWPERFIVNPEDPSSGPTRPQVDTNNLQNTLPETNAQPFFSLDGTQGSWVPYGGGSRMCPGRHFAKKELIVATAMFLTVFDFELAPQDDRIKDDMGYFMFGVMHPKGSVKGRVRRRKPVG